MEPIWEGILDGQYGCSVEALDGSSLGTLRISLGNKIIHTQKVALTYGAVFGPDVDDVREWQTICAEAVDKWERENAVQRP